MPRTFGCRSFGFSSWLLVSVVTACSSGGSTTRGNDGGFLGGASGVASGGVSGAGGAAPNGGTAGASGTTANASGGVTSASGGASNPDAGTSGNDGGVSGPDVTAAFVMDTPNVVRRSNLVLGSANTDQTQFVPLGNGTLGVAEWAANGFTAQLNRTDTFPDRKSPGQVTLPGLEKLTSASDFSAHLDLYDATLVESGGGMTATIYVLADRPELIVDVTGADPSSTQTAQIQLWSGRSPAAATAGAIGVLSETWKDDSQLGYSGETFGTLAAITAGGRNVTMSVVDSKTVQVAFQPNADGSFRVAVASPSWTGGDAGSTATSLLGSDATAGSATLRTGHLAWWHSFWNRVGLLKMTSSDGKADYFENLRALDLYTAAADSRGTVPGEQAGVADLFNFLQDHQDWYPAGYWFWNLRMQVAANISAGAFDLNAPLFGLYASNDQNLQAWTAAKMSGKSGICVPETMRFNGNGYYNGGEDNASCDQTIAPSYNSLTLTSGAEVALWIWQQYQATGDLAFLSANYPVLRDSAKFLLAFATTGADGLLHTVANAHETQWNVHDPITDIVAMQALFPAVVSAAQTLNVDAGLVTQLNAAIPKIPPLPRTDAANHSQVLTAADDASGNDVFALSLDPTAQKHNGENLDLEPVWPYGTISDSGPLSDVARRTYSHRMFQNGNDWSFDAVHAARLGLASEVAAGLEKSTESYQIYPSGLGCLSGDRTSFPEPYIEQLGVVATAIDEAFATDYDDTLRILPAWPAGWDGAGTLYVHGNSKIDVVVQGGALLFAVLEAGSTGPVKVRNPFSGQSTSVVDGRTNATTVAATASATFTIPATAGHWYLIRASAPSLPFTVTGSPATQAKHLGQRQIGL